MHSFSGMIMNLAVMMIAISNCRISAGTTARPETVRLVGGSRSSEGRVEVFLEGQWGTVCNNLWTLREANVVCRQLGYLSADKVFYNGAKFGEGVGAILLDMVQCEGTEDDLLNCPQGVNSGPACYHSEDVGVECTTRGSVRLANGPSYRRGRLEMLNDTEQWGTVCAQDWDGKDTDVACRQLGLGRLYNGDEEWFTAAPGSGSIVTGALNCTGNEDRLDNCTQAEDWTPENCDQSGHSQDIGVQCDQDINLQYEGLVVIYYGEQFGIICPDNWDENAANVACRHQGHKGAIETKTAINFEFYNYDIILRNPVCSGEETFYTECNSGEWAYQGDCSPETGAAVICELQEPYVFLYNDSPYPEIGEVLISFTDPFNSLKICYRAWKIEAAHVVCRQLRNPDGAVEIFPVETSKSFQVITDIDCPDDASSLADCTFETTYGDSAEDCDAFAGVVCFVNAEDSLVPLVGGESTLEGVLEYKISGMPAHICDPDWSNREATVACRMHGYQTGSAMEVISLGHSKDSFPVSFQNYKFTCLGSEATLAECQMEPIEGVDECNPSDVAQLRCQPNKNWDLRLVGSTASEQGRVEVFVGGEWGSIAFYDIQNLQRDELCKELGYEQHLYNTFHIAGGDNPFGEGTGKVLKCQYPLPDLCDDALSEVHEGEPRNETNVVCVPYDTVENHPIRLVSETGVANNETGRVEILHDSEWGAVCDSSHESNNNAIYREVCIELGYTDLQYAKYLTGADREPYLTGDEKIWLLIDDCPSSSRRLYTCFHGPWGYHPKDCTPAVVTCVRGDDDPPATDDPPVSNDPPVTDDPGNAPSMLHTRQTGLIAGVVILVLLIINLQFDL